MDRWAYYFLLSLVFIGLLILAGLAVMPLILELFGS